MEALYQKYKHRNFTVLAISLDTIEAPAVVAFVEKLKVTFDIALDPESEVAGVYGARALPSSFLIDPRGMVFAAAKGERDWFSEGSRSYLNEVLERHFPKLADG